MTISSQNRNKRLAESQKQECIRLRYESRHNNQRCIHATIQSTRDYEINRAIENPSYLKLPLSTIFEESDTESLILSPPHSARRIILVRKVKIGRFVVEDESSPKETKPNVRNVGRFTIYDDSPDK